ncbi:MAG: type II toxin-antitoxin system HipA family toxin [Gammaproteobacteria bacterium]|nr:MAG: type II toxin-antitoxin system HipA family toxin [Gammaproteobacteria bacterium]
MANRNLLVYFHDELVGRLDEDANAALSFTYESDYATQRHAKPLSQSLPVRAESFDHWQTRPFFSGLLPEGGARERVAKYFGVSERNDFSLLEKIGGECAGAVTLLPLEAGPPDHAPDYRRLDDTALARLLDELPNRPLLAGEDGVRLSLAGAQDKLPIYRDREGFALPIGGAPSSHILKPAIERFAGIVENEAFCLSIAGAAGLRAAGAEIVDVGNHRCLIVERYDRARNDDGTLRRLHQEDFCQALGLPPERKYQAEQGPSIATCFELIRSTARPPGPQILHFLDAIVLDFLVGNADAHAKNFALLHVNGTVVSPLYDVVSTAIYPELTPKMAMKIGSKYRHADVMPRHWRALGESAALQPRRVQHRVLQMCERMPDIAVAERDRFRAVGNHCPELDQIVDTISDRARSMVTRFEIDAKVATGRL